MRAKVEQEIPRNRRWSLLGAGLGDSPWYPAKRKREGSVVDTEKLTSILYSHDNDQQSSGYGAKGSEAEG